MKIGDTYIYFGDPRVKLASVWLALGMLGGFLLGLAACAPDQAVPEHCVTRISPETGRILPSH